MGASTVATACGNAAAASPSFSSSPLRPLIFLGAPSMFIKHHLELQLKLQKLFI
jgi:xanthine dehydrogenase iron-sulfur cluster and FAD-binding subunit A